MDSVDTLPMAILSGQYNQKSTYGTPMSDVMDIYNKRQPNIDVANARKGVADANVQKRTEQNQSAYNSKVGAEDAQLEKQIADIDARLNELEPLIKEAEATEASDKLETQGLQDIMNNKTAPTNETRVLPLNDIPKYEVI